MRWTVIIRSDPSTHPVIGSSTYQAITRLLLCESHVRPVVAVIDDLHWSDTLSLGLLNELVVATQNARLILIVTYRPDYRGPMEEPDRTTTS